MPLTTDNCISDSALSISRTSAVCPLQKYRAERVAAFSPLPRLSETLAQHRMETALSTASTSLRAPLPSVTAMPMGSDAACLVCLPVLCNLMLLNLR